MSIVSFFHQYDPRGGRVGGIGSYVNSFIENSDVSRVKVVGVSAAGGPLFCWSVQSHAGHDYDFLAVAHISDQNKKSKLPTTLRYFIGLLILRFFHVQVPGTHFFQRMEYTFPFWGAKNKKVMIIHNDLEVQLDRRMSEYGWARAKHLYFFLLKRAMASVDVVLSVSSKTISFMESENITQVQTVKFSPTWADPRKFFLLPENERLSVRSNFMQLHTIPDDMNTLLFVGRFQKQKNIDLLLDVIGELHGQYVLLLAGTGNQESEIRHKISSTDFLGEVIFLGNVPHDQLNSVLNSVDMYISTSFFEGMSVALLEALQAGLPVVTTPTGESGRIIVKANGNICDYSVDDFVIKIKRLGRFSYAQKEACSASISEFTASVAISKLTKELSS